MTISWWDVNFFNEKLDTSKYTTDNEISNLLKVSDVNKLSYNDRDKCDTFPFLAECKDTVMKVKLRKFPGLNGNINKFYEFFWDHLSRNKYFTELIIKSIILRKTDN